MIELTGFAKHGGPLTKRISLGADGTVCSDGSLCVMAAGSARRVPVPDLDALARLIGQLTSEEAIGLGALRGDLPDVVGVTTKAALEALNGSNTPPIARTGEYIVYHRGAPAVALLDFDSKSMPTEVAARIKALGGFWSAVTSVLPDLKNVGRVARKSTGAGLSRSDTGEQLPGSDGEHLYILVVDGADIERFLRALHDRCWLAGFAWLAVGAGGQLLDRSIVDRMVGAPERLVFEGSPVLDPPLVQDAACRRPLVTEGAALDTLAACPPLTVVEQAKLREMKAKDEYRLAPASAEVRLKLIGEQAKRIAERTGCTPETARRTVEQQCGGVLLSEVVLPFDLEEFEGATVADVLADPDRFVGATLADPLEGVSYGRCKAKIMRRASGAVWINSFAHGRTVYELKLSAHAIEAILFATPNDQLVAVFVRLMLAGWLAADEYQRLRDEVAQRTSINRRTIDQTLKDARTEQKQDQAREDATRRDAERVDTRPQLPVPADDDPWLPQMKNLFDVLSQPTQPIPASRDIDGERSRLKMTTIPEMHLLQPTGDTE